MIILTSDENTDLTQTFTLKVVNVDEAGSIAALAAPVQGTALSVPAITDPDGSVVITAREWQRFDDADDTSATVLGGGVTYTPVQADVGKLLKLKVTYNDGQGNGKTVTTAFSAVVVIADTPIASVGGVQFEAAFQHEDPAAVWELTPFAKTNQVYQAVIEITGDDPGPVVWSVEGTDKDLFNIDSSTGKVTFSKAVTLDYETKSSYSFTVVATVGGMAFR